MFVGLRSAVEDRRREAAKAAGKGANLEAVLAVDPPGKGAGVLLIEDGGAYRVESLG